MKITDEQKQLLKACTTATAAMTAILAAAGTLCIYAEAGAIDEGVVLLVSSARAGELVAAYANLATDLSDASSGIHSASSITHRRIFLQCSRNGIALLSGI